MTEQELHKLIENWDIREYEKQADFGMPATPEELNDRKVRENRHKNMLEGIWFLAKHFFCEYELNLPRPFKAIFYDWIGQFRGFAEDRRNDDPLNLETRYAFILTRNIIFFNRRQVLSLIDDVWNAIKKELFILVSQQNNLPITNLMSGSHLIEDQLNASLFVPLSDSSHFMEFRHVLPEGIHGRITIPCIDRLTLSIELKAQEYTERIKARYKDQNNLFILEDFAGSGTTAKRKIQLILTDWHFKNVYFCPLIVCHKAKEELGKLEVLAHENGKRFKLICGVTLDRQYSIVDEKEGSIWRSEEKAALRFMSEKYFESHFKENGYLYSDFDRPHPKHPTPFGFKNGGLAVVLYSNCPNNSLPIIWGDEKGWNSLFRRHERYKRVLRNDR